MPNSGLENDMQRFFSSKAAIPIGLVLTMVFCISLLYVETSGTLCFGTLLIAISAYAIPRYFGLKDVKRLMIWGVVFLFLISGAAMMFTESFYGSGQMQTVSSSDGTLSNASVDPYTLNELGIYRFTVIDVESDYDEIILQLGTVETVYLTYITGGQLMNYTMSEDLNYTGTGIKYYVDVALEPGNNHFFVIKGYKSSVLVSYTSISPWPTLINESDANIFYFMGNFYYLSLNVGLPFFVLAFFSWWIRRNMDRTIARMREEGRIPPLETICPQCGQPNPNSVRACKQCGGPLPVFQPIAARVQASKKETFICSECGADVDDEATVCPKCGEPFDE